MFKSSSVEGHQLKKNWLRPRPQYTQVYLILTLSFRVALNTTKHHKTPQTTTKHHKPPQNTPQNTTNQTTKPLKPKLIVGYTCSDPNLGRKCTGGPNFCILETIFFIFFLLFLFPLM